MQNEYYYKNKLENVIEKYINDITKDDNEFGFISNDMARNMTEAAQLILKQNKSTNEYFEKEDLLKP